jgi:hypothetical protein
MKTYVLTVSRTFPTTHARAGEPTHFLEKIISAIGGYENQLGKATGANKISPKIHTIRANYNLWKKRMDDVQAGKAVISLRYWSEKPYNSKQIEFARLDKDSGCGVQEIYFKYECVLYPRVSIDKPVLNLELLAQNDGLSKEDFKEWFKSYDLSKPMAIIHFTKFRY